MKSKTFCDIHYTFSMNQEIEFNKWLPSVRLERYYSLINGGAAHYRKCPIAWDSKWFLYSSWLLRAEMVRCWLLLLVKHRTILQDERKGNCGIAGMLLPCFQIPNSGQLLSELSQGRIILMSSQQIGAVDNLEFTLVDRVCVLGGKGGPSGFYI